MKLGAFSISLTVKNITSSKEFYEKLGFKLFAGNIEENYLILKNGGSVIGLFQGMFDKNILTFNPGWDQDAKEVEDFDDIRTLGRKFKNQGLMLLDESTDGEKGPGSFSIADPDGNIILFDQHI